MLDVKESDLESFPASVLTDRREWPRYTVSEVASYLHLPEKTLRSWVFGRTYPAAGGARFSPPLIEMADGVSKRLSFYNLVEAHILKSTRQRDEVPMGAIRDALDYVSAVHPAAHPLIVKEFYTEGRFLFENMLEKLVNSSKYGQLAFGPLMLSYLERIDRDSVGYPSTLYPFVPNRPESKVVVIKPEVSSGVPTVSGTGISIPILYGRYSAGDSIPDLADDYGLSEEQVEDAIAYLEAA